MGDRNINETKVLETDNPEYNLWELKNGIRVFYKQVKSTRIMHCGYFIDAGSRDEKTNEAGLAHLIEHMLFKGTRKRSATRILNRLEVVGGELNAFTTKDKTIIYASIVADHTLRAIDLLTDITFYSVFPDKELEKEKKVIYEEIDMYLDTPEERIFDDFQEKVYANHPLGVNILGTKDHIAKFSRKNILAFIKRNYASNRIVVGGVGPWSPGRFIRMLEKIVAPVKINPGDFHRNTFEKYRPFNTKEKTTFVQSHTMVGGPAYPQEHELRPALMLLINILAGPSLNSRLNLLLREKHAYTYSVEASYQTLTDTGLFNIYWSCEASNNQKVLKLVLAELNRWKKPLLSEFQLNKYKQQFKGQMIMGEESNLSLMFLLGKSILDLEKVESLEYDLEKVDNITNEQLVQVANEIFSKDNLSTLNYLPESNN